MTKKRDNVDGLVPTPRGSGAVLTRSFRVRCLAPTPAVSPSALVRPDQRHSSHALVTRMCPWVFWNNVRSQRWLCVLRGGGLRSKLRLRCLIYIQCARLEGTLQLIVTSLWHVSIGHSLATCSLSLHVLVGSRRSLTVCLLRARTVVARMEAFATVRAARAMPSARLAALQEDDRPPLAEAHLSHQPWTGGTLGTYRTRPPAAQR